MLHYTICTYEATKQALLRKLQKAKAQYGPLKFAHFATDKWSARHTPDSYVTLDCRYTDPETAEAVAFNVACRRFNVKHTNAEIKASIRELLSELGFDPGQELSSTFTVREVEEEDDKRAEIELAEAAALEEAIGIEQEEAANSGDDEDI